MAVRRFLTLALVALLGAAPTVGVLATLPGGARAATTPSVLQEPGTTSPFSPGVPESTPTVATNTTSAVVTSTTTSSDSGLSGSSVVVIAVGALAILAGIAYLIWRDARRHARIKPNASDGGAGSISGGRSGSKPPPKPRKLSAAERKRRKRGRAR